MLVRYEGGPALTVGTQSCWGIAPAPPTAMDTKWAQRQGVDRWVEPAVWLHVSGAPGPGRKDVTTLQAMTGEAAVSFNRKAWEELASSQVLYASMTLLP